MRSQRSVGLADHLWELYGRMADEMGSDREALVNQAMLVYARLLGYAPAGGAGIGRPAATPPPEAERREVAERVLETANRLEREVLAGEGPPPIPTGPVAPGGGSLVLVRDDGTETPVVGERFLIGRGRHCGLVVDSSKVSREHAAVVREGDGWIIEDLRSSNGTWHHQARIDRRRIEDGDEYFVCAERVRCIFRS